MDDELDRLNDAVQVAARDVREAKVRLATAENVLDDAKQAQLFAELPALETLNAVALGERIADHARAHEPGKTDIHWRMMRRAIAALVTRAEAAKP